MKKSKILILDIETSMLLLGGFDLKPYWTSPDHVFEDFFIICAAWKWLGSKKIEAVSVKPGKLHDDKQVVKQLIKVINEADIVVGHNIDRFDIKKIKTRCLFHGLPVPQQVQTVDTLKVARREFLMTSNRLDYLGKYLGVGGKTDNTRGLWQRIARGDGSALKDMLKYNKNDVKIQEKVYLKLLGYVSNHPNMNVILESEKLVCTNCGSNKVKRNGYRATIAGKYLRYRCNDCGASFRGKSVVKRFDGR